MGLQTHGMRGVLGTFSRMVVFFIREGVEAVRSIVRRGKHARAVQKQAHTGTVDLKHEGILRSDYEEQHCRHTHESRSVASVTHY